ncbi:MAG: hypothetical protein GY781_01185 [Gammaproteobacteria bacterium]|nr:hypothetical protein [Gammaproteobacteria bacterium]
MDTTSYLINKLWKKQPKIMAQTMDMMTGVDMAGQKNAWSVIKGRLSSMASASSESFMYEERRVILATGNSI